MKLHFLAITKTIPVLFITLLPGVGQVAAQPSGFTGTFDGTEPATEALEGSRPECGDLAYIQSSPFQTSDPGIHTFFEALQATAFPLCIGIYSGSFNPNDVSQNRVAAFDGVQDVNLQMGQDYIAVAQPLCFGDGTSPDALGPFGVGATPRSTESAGTVSGDSFKPLPSGTNGIFDGSEPSADLGNGNLWYDEAGPLRVPESGRYFYFDVYNGPGVDVVVAVYSAPVDPGNPTANRLFVVDDFGVLDLQKDTDYYVVAQPFGSNQNGRWLFTLASPTAFFLNASLNGSWFNPAFPGQGFFLDVFPVIKQLFLAWFTYDVAPPADPSEATVGAAGHRWLTAFGPYTDNQAELAIELTQGGLFVDTQAVSQDTMYGTINIEFQDCENGTVVYDIPDAMESGTIPITRIVDDNVERCENETGVPGELLTE